MQAIQGLGNNRKIEFSDASTLDRVSEIVSKRELTLQQVDEIILKNPEIERFLIKEKAVEERKVLLKVHDMVVRAALFLPKDVKKKFEKISVPQEMEEKCESWEDIEQYTELFVHQIMGTLRPLEGFDRVAARVEVAFLDLFYPFPCRITKQEYELDERDRVCMYKVAYNTEEERKFFPDYLPRVRRIFQVVVATLLATSEERYNLAIEQALKGEYKGEEGDLTLRRLASIQWANNEPFEEILEIGSKMEGEQKRAQIYELVFNEMFKVSERKELFASIKGIFEKEENGEVQNAIIAWVQKHALENKEIGIKKKANNPEISNTPQPPIIMTNLRAFDHFAPSDYWTDYYSDMVLSRDVGSAVTILKGFLEMSDVIAKEQFIKHLVGSNSELPKALVEAEEFYIALDQGIHEPQFRNFLGRSAVWISEMLVDGRLSFSFHRFPLEILKKFGEGSGKAGIIAGLLVIMGEGK